MATLQFRDEAPSGHEASVRGYRDMDDREPLVSVITPAYNCGRFIQQTIDSVRAQSFANWEMIIVDDASRDDTCDIVERNCALDRRIRLIRSEQNGGVADARNRALSAARGRFFAFLDSDDLWLPSKLEEQIRFMWENGVAFSYTQYRHISEDGKRCGSLIVPPDRFDHALYLKNTGIGCLTVILERQAIGDLSFVTYPPHEDHILWSNILKRGIPAHALQRDLARYRIVNKSASRKKIKAAYSIWRIYRDIEKLPFFYSALCFFHYAWNAMSKQRTLPRGGRG
jgi:teichuronic acid biosynthesis glycosyltransferase TuaG